MADETEIIELLSPELTINKSNIVTRSDFETYNYVAKSNNIINTDGPLYQYLEYHYYEVSEFNRKITTVIKYGRLDILKTLEGVTKQYFYYACRFNHTDIIRWFISNFRYIDMNLALDFSCIYGSYKTTNILIENGVDVNANNGRAIVLASLNNNYDTVKLLINNGADVGTFNNICFVLACENGNLEIVRLLIENGCNIHTTGEYELTEEDDEEWEEQKDQGFKLACKYGHIEVILMLLEFGIDVNNRFNLSCMIELIDRLLKNDTSQVFINNKQNIVKHLVKKLNQKLRILKI